MPGFDGRSSWRGSGKQWEVMGSDGKNLFGISEKIYVGLFSGIDAVAFAATSYAGH
jgi:hypothetical protein